MTRRIRLGIRWTIGNVSTEGFEALRLSVLGAHALFGASAKYVVYTNGRSVDEARRLTGPVPWAVEWREARREELPAFLRPHLDDQLAEGVAWKFIPLRAFPDRYELSLDNDCILWKIPPALAGWLNATDNRMLIAEDVAACFGAFAASCGEAPLNSGIRGVPPGEAFERALRDVLSEIPAALRSETDEQGLQVAALSRGAQPFVVSTSAVTICSPFYTHQQHLGTCGAHFVGLNARHLPWDYYGRPAVEWLREHWQGLKPAVEHRIHAVVSGRPVPRQAPA